MSYRNDPNRRAQQTRIIQHTEGQTAVWRQFISAEGGNPTAGYGLTPHYREQVVTAVFARGADMNKQNQYAGGTLADGDFAISTRYPMNQRDEVMWNGVRYRVDANSQKSPMNGQWMTVLRRGDNS